jgi:hypothetical protein
MFKHDTTGLGAVELEAQTIEALPERATMSLVNANLALPINAAVAANVLSDGAISAANAQQQTPITQGLMLQPPTTTT